VTITPGHDEDDPRPLDRDSGEQAWQVHAGSEGEADTGRPLEEFTDEPLDGEESDDPSDSG
jgi:hypothetical protein